MGSGVLVPNKRLTILARMKISSDIVFFCAKFGLFENLAILNRALPRSWLNIDWL